MRRKRQALTGRRRQLQTSESQLTVKRVQVRVLWVDRVRESWERLLLSDRCCSIPQGQVQRPWAETKGHGGNL